MLSHYQATGQRIVALVRIELYRELYDSVQLRPLLEGFTDIPRRFLQRFPQTENVKGIYESCVNLKIPLIAVICYLVCSNIEMLLNITLISME